MFFFIRTYQNPKQACWTMEAISNGYLEPQIFFNKQTSPLRTKQTSEIFSFYQQISYLNLYFLNLKCPMQPINQLKVSFSKNEKFFRNRHFYSYFERMFRLIFLINPTQPNFMTFRSWRASERLCLLGVLAGLSKNYYPITSPTLYYLSIENSGYTYEMNMSRLFRLCREGSIEFALNRFIPFFLFQGFWQAIYLAVSIILSYIPCPSITMQTALATSPTSQMWLKAQTLMRVNPCRNLEYQALLSQSFFIKTQWCVQRKDLQVRTVQDIEQQYQDLRVATLSQTSFYLLKQPVLSNCIISPISPMLFLFTKIQSCFPYATHSYVLLYNRRALLAIASVSLTQWITFLNLRSFYYTFTAQATLLSESYSSSLNCPRYLSRKMSPFLIFQTFSFSLRSFYSIQTWFPTLIAVEVESFVPGSQGCSTFSGSYPFSLNKIGCNTAIVLLHFSNCLRYKLSNNYLLITLQLLFLLIPAQSMNLNKVQGLQLSLLRAFNVSNLGSSQELIKPCSINAMILRLLRIVPETFSREYYHTTGLQSLSFSRIKKQSSLLIQNQRLHKE